MMADNFVLELIGASEKAANIARTIRAKKELFSLLVEEKDAKEKNQRFIRDFKTLADVLIQQTIKFDLLKKFPSLDPDEIRGEESNRFTNSLGESVVVEVKQTTAETAAMLAQVLNNNWPAAEALAAVVHSASSCLPNVSDQHIAQCQHLQFPLETFGIWIDPIDSTAEYIQGKDEINSEEICSSGLPCVTVLIGVYDRVSGQPLIGVVNQPFHQFHPQDGTWIGHCEWGVNWAGQTLSSLKFDVTPNGHSLPRALISVCEDESTKQALMKDYQVQYAAGAGYKLLCVALGIVDIYILSKATTFRWDLCAPHALLNCCGGGIVCYQQMIHTNNVHQITYHQQTEAEVKEGGAGKWCNTGGIIAYRNKAVAKHLSQLLKQENAN